MPLITKVSNPLLYTALQKSTKEVFQHAIELDKCLIKYKKYQESDLLKTHCKNYYRNPETANALKETIKAFSLSNHSFLFKSNTTSKELNCLSERLIATLNSNQTLMRKRYQEEDTDNSCTSLALASIFGIGFNLSISQYMAAYAVLTIMELNNRQFDVIDPKILDDKILQIRIDQWLIQENTSENTHSLRKYA